MRSGPECVDLAEARTQAITASGQMITELAAKFWDDPEDWQMNVKDAAGEHQFTLRFAPR
jgi:hypothetical protein